MTNDNIGNTEQHEVKLGAKTVCYKLVNVIRTSKREIQLLQTDLRSHVCAVLRPT